MTTSSSKRSLVAGYLFKKTALSTTLCVASVVHIALTFVTSSTAFAVARIAVVLSLLAVNFYVMFQEYRLKSWKRRKRRFFDFARRSFDGAVLDDLDTAAVFHASVSSLVGPSHDVYAAVTVDNTYQVVIDDEPIKKFETEYSLVNLFVEDDVTSSVAAVKKVDFDEFEKRVKEERERAIYELE